MPRGISAYLTVYNNFDILPHTLRAIAPYVDELVVVDGAYEWMVPYLDITGADPDRSNEAMYDALETNGINYRVVTEIWRDKPGKRMAGYAACNERNREMIDSLDGCIEMLALVKPDVIVIAHTATSYHLGCEREAVLLARLAEASGVRIVTAFGSVVAALERLGVRRLSLGAPYSAETTAQGKAHLEAHGYTVVCWQNLKGVTNIYDETAERAYRLARSVDRPEAEAVFLSGTGMPTLPVLEALEHDLGKPVISSASAMMWHALRRSGVRQPILGHGCLLTLD